VNFAQSKRTMIVEYRCGHVREEAVLDFDICADIYLNALKETDCPACQFMKKSPQLGQSIIIN
jgi:hypothetical protein